MKEVSFEPGEYVFREGDQSGKAYRIRSGFVLVQLSVEGRESTLGRLGPGEFVGETSLVDEHPRSASAVSLDHTVLEEINETELHSMLESDPDMLHHYLESLYLRLRTTSALLRIELRKALGGGGSVEQALVHSEIGFPKADSPRQNEKGETLPTFSIEIKSVFAESEEPIEILVEDFPFRIGRCRREEVVPPNTLLIDDHEPYHISRRHCCLQLRERHIVLTDLGSHLGSMVNGEHIGGQSQFLTAPLNEGENDICLGGSHSPYQFVFTVREQC